MSLPRRRQHCSMAGIGSVFAIALLEFEMVSRWFGFLHFFINDLLFAGSFPRFGCCLCSGSDKMRRGGSRSQLSIVIAIAITGTERKIAIFICLRVTILANHTPRNMHISCFWPVNYKCSIETPILLLLQ